MVNLVLNKGADDKASGSGVFNGLVLVIRDMSGCKAL